MHNLVSKNQMVLDLVYEDGTYSVFENSNPTKGYVGAIKEYRMRYSDDLSYFDVVKFVEFYVNHFWGYVKHANNTYFGRWLDTETNHVYLDIVKVFENEKDAAMYAKSQGEIAYYDLNNMVEVRV